MWSQLVVGLITSVLTFLVTRCFLRWDRLQPEDVGIATSRKSVPRFGTGLLLGLLLVAAQTSLVLVMGHVRWVRAPGTPKGLVVVALIAYTLLAAREELAFRGYPLRLLDSRFGLLTAQLVVAMMFALEHVAGGHTWTNAVLGAAVGSLLFGMAAIATRGLGLPIGLHAAWNFGQWMLGEKDTAGTWRPVVAPGYQSVVEKTGLVAYLVVFGLAIVGFWMVWRNRQRPVEGETAAVLRR